MTVESSQRFLEKLRTAKHTSSVYLFDYLGKAERETAFQVFNSEAFPWQKKPKLYGESLPQHAYYFDRTYVSQKKIRKSPGLSLLEELCASIEQEFDVKVYDVYCNRLENPNHHLGWHKDTFGTHIFVLSLGSQRTVEFRENSTGVIDSVRPKAGQMYFMPLGVNKTHQHRVCQGQPNDGTRISFVFFVKTPKYAKEFKISKMDKYIGYIEDVLSNPT